MAIVKKRRIAVGLVAAGAILGAFLAGMFSGMGLGPGIGVTVPSDGPDSADPDNSQSVPPAASTGETPVTQTGTADIVADGTAPQPLPEVQSPVLDVIVDGRSYLVTIGFGQYADVDLEEVIRRAKLAPGNEDGVRIFIRRRPNARVTAWQTLHAQLLEAGLPFDAIRLTDESGER